MEDRPPIVFAHHLQALLSRQSREDLEAIGAAHRFRFRDQVGKSDKRDAGLWGGSLIAGVDFHRASPLTGRDRQVGGFRVPHFDMKPISFQVRPTSATGKVFGSGSTAMSAVQHFDYVTNGAKVGMRAHLDYICRQTGFEHPVFDLKIDALDEQDLRDEKNRLAVVSNIPGGRERQCSLFEAAERTEPKAKTFLLSASTKNIGAFETILAIGNAPGWFRKMTVRLRATNAEVLRAAKGDKPAKHRNVVLASVTSEEAYERLSWVGNHARVPGLLKWKQGPGGRCQYRFVAELPDGLTATARHTILQRFCDLLSEIGWMVVGAIHHPDAHNDRRNFHIHIDCYDRPARWLDDHGCWDFEYTERRNGKVTHPFRQNKVRYSEQSANGKARKVNTAKLLRERFIDIVNEVAGTELGFGPYLHGSFKDNGIDLVPLDHMGNRAIGLEKRGVATEVGSRNAGRIVADELAACERRALLVERGLADEMELTRRAIVDNADDISAMVDHYERLQRDVIQRRLDVERAAVIVAMARSRADAVITSLTPSPRHRVQSRANDAELRHAAREHLRWVGHHSPTRKEILDEGNRLELIERRSANLMKQITAAVKRAEEKQRLAAPITFRPRHGALIVSSTSRRSKFDDLERGRLLAWLQKHAGDPDFLVVKGQEARLGPRATKSIDRLMKKHVAAPEVQRELRGARERQRAKIATPMVPHALPAPTLSLANVPIVVVPASPNRSFSREMLGTLTPEQIGQLSMGDKLAIRALVLASLSEKESSTPAHEVAHDIDRPLSPLTTVRQNSAPHPKASRMASEVDHHAVVDKPAAAAIPSLTPPDPPAEAAPDHSMSGQMPVISSAPQKGKPKVDRPVRTPRPDPADGLGMNVAALTMTPPPGNPAPTPPKAKGALLAQAASIGDVPIAGSKGPKDIATASPRASKNRKSPPVVPPSNKGGTRGGVLAQAARLGKPKAEVLAKGPDDTDTASTRATDLSSRQSRDWER